MIFWLNGRPRNRLAEHSKEPKKSFARSTVPNPGRENPARGTQFINSARNGSD